LVTTAYLSSCVDVRRTLSATEMWPKECSHRQYQYVVKFSEISYNECVRHRHPLLDSKNSTCTILRGNLPSSWAFSL